MQLKRCLFVCSGGPVFDWMSCQNAFVLVRHGESTANKAGIIVSDPRNGVGAHGLTELGKAQARAAGAELARSLSADSGTAQPVAVVSSDFARAKETADAIKAAVAEAPPVAVDIRLRERFFGSLELQPSSRYCEVWEKDKVNASHTELGVEAVTAVLSRAKSVVLELDRQYRGTTIVLVAHGDT